MQEDKAKIDGISAAANVGFDQLDRGEGIEFGNMDELDAHVDRIATEITESNKREIFEKLSAEIAQQIGGSGATEDAILSDFEAWRKAPRKVRSPR